MSDLLKVLIVGGYGTAGQAVARTAARRLTAPLKITLSGRDGRRARAICDALVSEGPAHASLDTLELNAKEEDQLTAALRGHDIVIWCAPLDAGAARGLVGALTATGSDCVDVAPDRSKYPVLRHAAADLAAAGCRYVMDAGADPGLPGWLVHHVSRLHGAPEDVEVVARYRDKDIGRAGIEDILDGMAGQSVFDGRWRPAHALPVWRNFPGGLGRALTLPVFLEELRGLPAYHGLSRLYLRHAGMNFATDAVTMAAPLLPRKAATTLFARAARRFTHTPSALGIRAVAQDGGRKVTAELWRTGLYEATAEAALLGVEAILEGSPPGLGFLWEWDRRGAFAAHLAERNFTLTTKEG